MRSTEPGLIKVAGMESGVVQERDRAARFVANPAAIPHGIISVLRRSEKQPDRSETRIAESKSGWGAEPGGGPDRLDLLRGDEGFKDTR